MSDAIDMAATYADAERERLANRVRETIARPGAIYCEGCVAEIPPERRAAAPFATRCIDCQTKFERGA